MKKLLYVLLLALGSNSLSAQTSSATLPPALSSIRETDLKQDIFALAADNMRGKRAGTIDELRAAAWVAEQARKAGLQPAGDDGTYFQYFPLRRTTVAEGSTLTINQKPLTPWKNAWITVPVESHVDASVTWLKTMADTSADLKGKVVAMNLQPPAKLPAKGMSLWVYRYALTAIRQQAAAMNRQGVTAVILVHKIYKERLQEYLSKLRSRLLNKRISYRMISMDQPLDQALRVFLSQRNMLRI